MSKKKAKKAKKKLPSFIYKLLPFLSIVLAVYIVAGSNLFNILGTSNTAKELCANSISCIKDLTGKFEPNQTQAMFMGKAVSIPQYIAKEESEQPVLGVTTAEKKIYIDLSTQRLYAFEDSKLVYDFPVSTGKWGATPTGTFNIWVKLRYTRMTGGNPAIGTYYNLPNVPYTMFFYNSEIPKSRGYGVHGAYWHNNFGHPMSHGCVNMREEDVAQLYSWAQPPSSKSITYAGPDNPGTEIIIYGTAPNE